MHTCLLPPFPAQVRNVLGLQKLLDECSLDGLTPKVRLEPAFMLLEQRPLGKRYLLVLAAGAHSLTALSCL